MAARRPFWKWCWKSIGFCQWPPSTCIWNFKLKFQSKLDLFSGNHVVYRQTDGRTDRRTDKVNPVYPPPTSLAGGYDKTHSDATPCFRYNFHVASPNGLVWLISYPNAIDYPTLTFLCWFWCESTMIQWFNQLIIPCSSWYEFVFDVYFICDDELIYTRSYIQYVYICVCVGMSVW